jgi:hypothetical protein
MLLAYLLHLTFIIILVYSTCMYMYINTYVYVKIETDEANCRTAPGRSFKRQSEEMMAVC